MKIIDINRQVNVKLKLYPDNQPHVNIEDIHENDEVYVRCSILNSQDLIYLVEVATAIDTLFAKKVVLDIPYLMAARFDRVMEVGDSFDLKVIANIINLCDFRKVILHDVHSDVATALINNSVNISNRQFVETYSQQDAILICPDAGAVKKVGKYLSWNKNLTDVVYVNKTRDLSNGNLTLKVLEPEKCKDRNCVIIDDLCDGGGTFLGIASQIEPKHLTLIVTHGIFSKECKIFEGVFNEIITSNSYCRTYDSGIINVRPI